MKTLFFFTTLLLATSVTATTNLSDAIDANEVPASEEQRQEETFNKPEALDANSQPEALEDRQQKEEWREDYDELQDDMRKQNKKRE